MNIKETYVKLGDSNPRPASKDEPPSLSSYENGKGAPRPYKSPKVPQTTIEGHQRGNG